jgi:hypothetical protein
MDRKNLKRLQTISHRLNRDRTELHTEFITTLKKKLAERKHRADLSLVTASRETAGTFNTSVKFNPDLGHPSETDLLTLVAQAYPTHEIDWELVNVDPAAGIVTLVLEPSVEVVPVASINEIPPEFVSLGTGMYKRAADASGKVNEIWSLKKNENGLGLYRNQDDLEIVADEDGGFKAGDVVNTPHGPGKIQRFDELGNAFVQIGSQKRLISASEMTPYDVDKERKSLENYYAEAYGDREFAKSLTKKVDDGNK